MRSMKSVLHFTRLSVLPAVLVLVFVMFLPFSSAQAARITKVKGKKVLVDIENSDIQEGQKYFVVVDGKKIAVILVSQVKNGRALADITKGHAEVDAGVEPVKKSAAKSDDAPKAGDDNAAADGDAASKSEGDKAAGEGQDTSSGGGDKEASSNDDMVLKKKESAKKGSGPGLSVGVLLGYAMDSQTLPDPNGASVAMTGSGYSLKAVIDYGFTPRIGVIARLGVEQFNLTGSSTLGSWTTSITYLTTDALLRFNFTTSKFVPFFELGLGVHYPLSKSSNILNVPQISATTVLFGGLGFNYNMSKKTFLTLLAEYGYFPPSNNISTSLITFRAGGGMHF